jgi:hypothetical protein
MSTHTCWSTRRAGLDLRVSPFDYRVARDCHGIEDLQTALRMYAVIGGVAAYAREMSEADLPAGPNDFDRWICRRVLSPAAPLSNEVALLLIGEAKAGERITSRHLHRLEAARSALGDRAAGARLLLFGVQHAPGLGRGAR